MKKISIVTVCYQDLVGLKKTIASLQEQTSYDFDQWIIDGGSTDGTKEYLQNLKVPWQLHWVSEKDAGIYDAMNKGTSLAVGEYLWFLNSGDTAANSEVLSIVLSKLKEHQPDILYGKAWYISAFDKKSVGRKISSGDFLTGMPICHQSIFYLRNKLIEFPYMLEFRIISDWIVTQKIFETTQNTQFIDIYVSNFYLDGISSKNHLKMFKEKFIYEKTLFKKLKVVLFFGSHLSLIWILKKIKLYKFLKSLLNKQQV